MRTSFKEWLEIREARHAPELYQQVVALARQQEPLLTSAQIATQLNVSDLLVRNTLIKNLSPEELLVRKKQISTQTMKQKWAKPEFRAKQVNAAPAAREKQVAASKQNWADPTYREKAVSGMKMAAPARAEERGEIARQKWADPAHREKRAALYQDPAYSERLSQSHKDLWNDPAYRERMTKILQARAKDPEFRAKLPQWNDYWGWLATFPLQKRRQIIIAMMRDDKNLNAEDRERMISAMLAKAATLDSTTFREGTHK